MFQIGKKAVDEIRVFLRVRWFMMSWYFEIDVGNTEVDHDRGKWQKDAVHRLGSLHHRLQSVCLSTFCPFVLLDLDLSSSCVSIFCPLATLSPGSLLCCVEAEYN